MPDYWLPLKQTILGIILKHALPYPGEVYAYVDAFEMHYEASYIVLWCEEADFRRRM